ncbi:MAG: ShlB/FhaC/HecB family hemolysin secretion/activation protein [Pseudomonadota bacterium]|nr:ShlB/FhaC/HecB family hemolysin secretion/activation protein [Pseudomonadota bacterium]
MLGGYTWHTSCAPHRTAPHRTLTNLLSRLGLIGLVFTPPALAASPDAGRLLDTVRQPEAVPQPPRVTLPPETRPAEAAPDSAGALIRVKQFRIEGATLFPPEALAALLADLQDRELSLAQTREAAARVTRHYREAGYFVARAYLPPQTAADGVLTLRVVEGRYGEIQPGAATDPDTLRATLGKQGVAAGQPIRRDDLERGLLLLEDLGNAGVRASLRPGVSVGTGDLLVDATGLPPITGDLGLDTFGAESSGQVRLNAGIGFNGGRGDLARLRLTHASGLDYLSASYQSPAGHNGLKLGISQTWMRYDLDGTFAALGAQGDSRITALNAAYPLILNQRGKLHASASLEHKALKDDTSAGNTADKRIDLATLGLSGVLAATPGRLYQGRASLTLGDLDLGRNPAQQAADAAAGRTQGSYAVLRGNWQSRFDLAGGRNLALKLEGQLPDGNLDSSEKLALGGPYAVRAYATGESAADAGLIAHLEWSTPLALELPGRTRFTAFLDAGYAQLNQNLYPGALAAGQRNSYGLYGAGGELAWSNASGLNASLSLAARLGEPPAQVTERDALRAWFSLQQTF